MRGKNTHNVGDIIRKLMKNPKLEGKLDELDALAIWDDLIGNTLMKYIVSQQISNVRANGTIFMTIIY